MKLFKLSRRRNRAERGGFNGVLCQAVLLRVEEPAVVEAYVAGMSMIPLRGTNFPASTLALGGSQSETQY